MSPISSFSGQFGARLLLVRVPPHPLEHGRSALLEAPRRREQDPLPRQRAQERQRRRRRRQQQTSKQRRRGGGPQEQRRQARAHHRAESGRDEDLLREDLLDPKERLKMRISK